MAITDDLAAAAASDGAFFAAASGSSETVTYTPRGGSPRTLTAAVYRSLPERFAESAHSLAPRLEIEIQQDAVLGVMSVDVGGDKVSVARQKFGTPETFTVKAIVAQDGSVWRLRL